jgi:hypothetical protein
MRHRNKGALVALTLFLLTSGFEWPRNQDHTPQWRMVTWDVGGFSVLLPDTPNSPEYLDAEMELPGRANKISAHRVVGYEGDAVYMVDYCDLPPEVCKSYLKDKHQDAMRRGKGQFSYRPISLGRNPGIEFKLLSKHAFGLSRHYLAGRRLFILTVSRPEQAEAPKNVDKFLGSFKIIDN